MQGEEPFPTERHDRRPPAPGEALPLVDFLDRAMSATALEEVWSLHVMQMAAYGFDRLLYAASRFGPRSGLPHPTEALVLSTLPAEYLRDYLDGGLYLVAPMVRWAAENVGARPFLPAGGNGRGTGLSATEQRLAALDQRFGVGAGYAIGFRDVSVRAKGGIGLYAHPDRGQSEVNKIWRRHGKELTVMNTVVHLRLSTLPSSARPALTTRQREALEWVASGKTMQEIAALMGLTAATVEKHLRLAREALGVDTTTQAVLHASIHNQIFVLSGRDDATA